MTKCISFGSSKFRKCWEWLYDFPNMVVEGSLSQLRCVLSCLGTQVGGSVLCGRLGKYTDGFGAEEGH
jgi:hypothetical protein